MDAVRGCRYTVGCVFTWNVNDACKVPVEGMRWLYDLVSSSSL